VMEMIVFIYAMRRERGRGRAARVVVVTSLLLVTVLGHDASPGRFVESESHKRRGGVCRVRMTSQT
jgi:hypothetical protein